MTIVFNNDYNCGEQITVPIYITLLLQEKITLELFDKFLGSQRTDLCSNHIRLPYGNIDYII